MNNPKVSVVMSVYNEEKYLREAVDSILNQTYRNFEFIIINDGSTDKTQEILESYADPRVRLITQEENMGLAKSLNRGLEIARGEYIARMDGDDISLPERLKKEEEFLDNHKRVGLVGSFSIEMDESGKEAHLCKIETEGEDFKKFLWEKNLFPHGAVMFRKECVKEAGCYREQPPFVEDYDLWLRISEIYDVATIEEPLYKWRVRPNSISIAHKFAQYRHTLLIKRTAEERRKYGRDRLKNLKKEEIDKILEDILPGTEHNEKKGLASSYLYLAEVSYCANDYIKSKEWLSKSLRLNPFDKRIWTLILKLLIYRLLTPRLINKLRGGGVFDPSNR